MSGIMIFGCVSFFHLVISNIILDSSFHEKNIITKTYHATFRSISFLFRAIQSKRATLVSPRSFMFSTLLIFSCLISTAVDFQRSFESYFVFIIILTLSSYLMSELVKLSNTTISNDSKTEEWFLRVLYIVLIEGLVMIDMEIALLEIIRTVLIIFTLCRILFKSNYMNDIFKGKSALRILYSCWISCSVYMVISFNLAETKYLLFDLELTAFILTVLLVALNMYISRQDVEDIKSVKRKSKYKIENYAMLALIVIGAIDWSI